MAAWTPRKAPRSSSTTLPPPPSSAGVPSTVTSRPRPAPAAMAAIRLWPQAWPTPGSASYSAQTTTRSGPWPVRAANAVGSPPTPRSTRSPAPSSASHSQAQARSSWKPSSGWAWMRWLSATSRSPAPSTRARVACFASLAIGCTLPERAARDHDGAIGVVPGDQRRRLAVPPPPQRHVGADVRVGQVLDRLEGTAAALLQPAQLAGEQAARVQPQRRGRRGQPAQQLPQGAQPLPALPRRAPLLPQRPGQAAELHDGRVREHLDRPPAGGAARLARYGQVRPRRGGDQLHGPHPAGQQGQVARQRAGPEPAVASLQLRLARPPRAGGGGY